MSTLPPLPPEWQAKVDQNYAGAIEMLAAMVSGARVDPKRNPADDADYHNTQVAMLKQWEKLMGDKKASGTRSALAAAVIALDALGWPDAADRRGAIDPNPLPAPRRRWVPPGPLDVVWLLSVVLLIGLWVGYVWGAA